MFRKFSQWFDTPPGKNFVSKDVCEHPGCQDEGAYRAPKSRYHLESGVDDWHWFCLIHIRDYTAKWNYYTNMSEAEIEKERRADVTWQRPSWPLGSASGPEKGSAQSAQFGESFQDPFGLFNDPFSPSTPLTDRFPPQSAQAKALVTLELSYPFSQNALRQQYKALVKKHHPDTHGGTPEAVEALKCINEAYEILKRLV